jgi:hypothetical protein
MNAEQVYKLISVLVLAALLFFPVSKLVWVLSMHRLQRKLNRELNPQEIAGQQRRARIITIFLVLIFAYLFSLATAGALP